MILIFLILVPGSLQAGTFEPWSKQDIIFQGILTVLIVVDLEQTKKWDEYNLKETNSIIGAKPSKQTLDSFILLGIIAHTSIAYFLPPKFRTNWQILFIGLETTAVRYNHANGRRIAINYGF